MVGKPRTTSGALAALAGLPLTVRPAKSAEIGLVILSKLNPVVLMGTHSCTTKVQLAPARSEPPLKSITLAPETTELAPQTLLLGRSTAASPGKTASRSSVKRMLMASTVLGLFRLNSSVVVSPAVTGASIKALLNTIATTSRSATAGGTVTGPPLLNADLGVPLMVPVKLLVVLVKRPGRASRGRVKATVKVQLAPFAARLPLDKVKGLPVRFDPGPQTSLTGNAALTVAPEMKASRSSLKSISVAADAASFKLKFRVYEWLRPNNLTWINPT